MICQSIEKFDIQGAQAAVKTWQDYQLVENLQEAQCRELYANMNSFDAVTDLKKKANKQDPFWIYIQSQQQSCNKYK